MGSAQTRFRRCEKSGECLELARAVKSHTLSIIYYTELQRTESTYMCTFVVRDIYYNKTQHQQTMNDDTRGSWM